MNQIESNQSYYRLVTKNLQQEAKLKVSQSEIIVIDVESFQMDVLIKTATSAILAQDEIFIFTRMTECAGVSLKLYCHFNSSRQNS